MTHSEKLLIVALCLLAVVATLFFLFCVARSIRYLIRSIKICSDPKSVGRTREEAEMTGNERADHQIKNMAIFIWLALLMLIMSLFAWFLAIGGYLHFVEMSKFPPL